MTARKIIVKNIALKKLLKSATPILTTFKKNNNPEIAKNTLVLNEEGKIFDSLNNIADVEKWLDSHNVPTKDWQDFISKWKHFK